MLAIVKRWGVITIVVIYTNVLDNKIQLIYNVARLAQKPAPVASLAATPKANAKGFAPSVKPFFVAHRLDCLTCHQLREANPQKVPKK